jgi:tRNA 2-selenouridine synthase
MNFTKRSTAPSVPECHKVDPLSLDHVLGAKLVPPEICKEQMKEWDAFAVENPTTGYLHCFRGGLRSNIVQEWVQQETDIRVPLVIGGYKVMWTYCMELLQSSLSEINLIRICGPIGSGKTRVLDQLPTRGINLEGLAHHRGNRPLAGGRKIQNNLLKSILKIP